MDKTKVIRVYETFAGIGAQHKALSNIDKSEKYFKVVQTSEWDARAVMAYAQIHNRKQFDKKLIEVKKWPQKEINKYIMDRTFSLNSKKPGHILRKSRDFQEALIAASLVNNNYPDITKVKGEQLKGIDLLTYSFPCQGLSIANMGRDKGIKEDSDSTSNLIWQIYRILEDAKSKNIDMPKYLLMENVKNLLSKKHKPDFDRWIDLLDGYGYTTYTFILNGFEHGALQKRERVFAISVLNGKRLFTNQEIKKMLDSKYGKKLSLDDRKSKYIDIMNSSDGMKDELLDARPKDTPSRQKMASENHDLDLFKRKWQKGREFTFNTLTTKQDRHPNVGMVKLPEILWEKGYLKNRFITAREGYQIMGFESSDFSKVKPLYEQGLINKESLYRQAGNSIVVQALESIFKFIKDLDGGKYE